MVDGSFRLGDSADDVPFDADAEYGQWPWAPGERQQGSSWRGAFLDYGIAVGLAEDVNTPAVFTGSVSNKFPYWGAPSTDLDHSYGISFTHHGDSDQLIALEYRDDYYPDNLVAGEPGATNERYRTLAVDVFRGVPASPTTLVATQGDGKIIELSWATRSAGLVTSFRIERSLDGNQFEFAGQADGDAAIFADVPEDWNFRYHYRVRAEGDFGVSAWSNIAVGMAINLPPRITPIEPQYAVADIYGGNTIIVDVEAIDPDGDSSKLLFEVLRPLGSRKPVFSSEIPGMLSWDTKFYSGGRHAVSFSVTDEEGLISEASFEVIVDPDPSTYITVESSTANSADPMNPQVVELSIDAHVDGDASDLSYSWTLVKKPSLASPTWLEPATEASTSLLYNAAGIYAFQVRVDHPDVDIESRYVNVTFDVAHDTSRIAFGDNSNFAPTAAG